MKRESLPWGTWEAVAGAQVALTGTMAAATLLAPRTLLRLFGVDPKPGTVLFFRAFGASLGYVAIMHQGLRRTRDASAARTVMIGNMFEDSLLTLLAARGVARGTLGGFGWVLIGAFASEVALNAWLLAQFPASAPEAPSEAS